VALLVFSGDSPASCLFTPEGGGAFAFSGSYGSKQPAQRRRQGGGNASLCARVLANAPVRAALIENRKRWMLSIGASSNFLKFI
jgi:hypothetical protein